MKVITKNFGEIEANEATILTFQEGIIGFPELKQFILIHDEESGSQSAIKWLQSLQEPNFAMPVMDPLVIVDAYNPSIEDEHMRSLGELNPEEMLVLVTVTVPKDITKMSLNLRAPIIINALNLQACQIIGDGEDYPVKYYFYDQLQIQKAGE